VDTSTASVDEVLASLVRIAQGAAAPAGARDTL
jgi:hypothetical protein